MRLIINGDDFGISKGCNEAIIQCYQEGVMTSTSLMTNMPYASEAALLSQKNPGLSVGLHFCLSAGKPLIKNFPLIKEDGTFDKKRVFNQGHLFLEEIFQELQAQYDLFLKLIKRKPDHLNSHCGIETIKGCGPILEEFSKRYDIPLRAFLNAPSHYDLSFEVPSLFIFSHQKEEDGILENEPITEIHPAFYRVIKQYTLNDLSSDRVYELVAHPGYPDKDLYKVSSLTNKRIQDTNLFQSLALKKWIEKYGIECISYADLRRKEN